MLEYAAKTRDPSKDEGASREGEKCAGRRHGIAKLASVLSEEKVVDGTEDKPDAPAGDDDVRSM